MMLSWEQIHSGSAASSLGQAVRIRGWLAGPEGRGQRRLTMEPPCCLGCEPGGSAILIDGIALPSGQMVCIEGELDRVAGSWTLRRARRVDPGFGRRRMLAAAPLLCLAAAAPASDPALVLADAATVDMHSHAGGLLRVRSNGPFEPVAAPMREGGLAIVCLAVVTDAPTHHLAADHRIHPFREPAPGELYDYAHRAFARLHALAAEQELRIVVDAAGLQAARADHHARSSPPRARTSWKGSWTGSTKPIAAGRCGTCN